MLRDDMDPRAILRAATLSAMLVAGNAAAVPNLQDLDKLLIGEHVSEILEADLTLERKAAEDLREAIEYCETVRDYVSRHLLREILESEEDAIEFGETQLALLQKMGEQNYIQLQSEPAS